VVVIFPLCFRDRRLDEIRSYDTQYTCHGGCGGIGHHFGTWRPLAAKKLDMADDTRSFEKTDPGQVDRLTAPGNFSGEEVKRGDET